MDADLRAKTRRCARLLVLTVGLAFAHLLYNWYLGFRLFELRGGVQKMPNGWTRFGGIDWAWTSPVYLPGCVVFEVGDKLYRRNHPRYDSPYPPQLYGGIGMSLILAGSLVAGGAVASLILAALHRQRPVLGRWLWRVWLAVLCWGWVLVPVEVSWVYRWTVIY